MECKNCEKLKEEIKELKLTISMMSQKDSEYHPMPHKGNFSTS
jgi:hypothetical protein